jgi:competence protein ComGC
MKSCSSRNLRALTLLEVLIIIALVAVLVILLLPATSGSRKSTRIACANNLMQIGMSVRIWAGDHGEKFPMQLSVTNGGTMEFIGTPETFRHFQAMSNELGTPRILFCPADTKRGYATNFTSDFNNARITYFVGVDATQSNAMMLLSGDRNITNGTAITRGLLELTTNRPAGWTSELHAKSGNVGLADASVQQVTTHGLQTLLEEAGAATNRIALP